MNYPVSKSLRYLTPALLLVVLAEIALWLPSYLTRPWFADHDVFATMAQGWDAGLKPYRDLLGNNFPGTIYLFWGLGKAFGWGRVPALYAADAGLFLSLGAMTLIWSVARFKRTLPGLVGLLAIASYYLNLDFSQAAQRDWHGPALVVLGLLAAQAWRNPVGFVLSALAFSAGMLFRPQVVLVVPALLLAVTERPALADASRLKILGIASAWSVLAGLFLVLGFLPLIREGLMPDFLRGLRAVAYGGSYSNTSLRSIPTLVLEELRTPRIAGVILALVVLAVPMARGPLRSLTTTWLVALAGVLLYAPLSPLTRPYLYHAMWLLWSINLAVLAALILEADLPTEWRVLSLLFALALAANPKVPRYSRPGPIRDAISALRERREVREAPPGYEHPYGESLVLPPWRDYCDLMAYLRDKTTPQTRVANLLKGVAVTGPSGRLTALPAESATWLFVVKRDDEPAFAKALEESTDSVVVWSPGEQDPQFSLPKLDEVVRRLYVPDARFGTIEVWRRRPKD